MINGIFMGHRTGEASITHLGDEASFSVTGEHDVADPVLKHQFGREAWARIESIPKTEAMRGSHGVSTFFQPIDPARPIAIMSTTDDDVDENRGEDLRERMKVYEPTT
jgi:hypothetical protein